MYDTLNSVCIIKKCIQFGGPFSSVVDVLILNIVIRRGGGGMFLFDIDVAVPMT